MAGFFKKAVSVFVEIDDTPSSDAKTTSKPDLVKGSATTSNASAAKVALSNEEVEKFEKHFDQLLNDSNTPGPDYFEFCKTMEALETHLTDDKTLFTAVFASLSAQGLTKEQLVTSANNYKAIIEKDKAKFELAVNDKVKADIDSKKAELDQLAKKIQADTDEIKRLTQEISLSQAKIQALNGAINTQNDKLKANTEGYNFACNAMLNKITLDIQKIQSLI